MKIFLSALKFTNNCKVLKKKLYFCQLDTQKEKKNIKKQGQRLSKLPAEKKMTILLEFFEKQQELEFESSAFNPSKA